MEFLYFGNFVIVLVCIKERYNKIVFEDMQNSSFASENTQSTTIQLMVERIQNTPPNMLAQERRKEEKANSVIEQELGCYLLFTLCDFRRFFFGGSFLCV